METDLEDGKPLFTILDNLLSNPHKENTNLTNDEILNILKGEFSLPISDYSKIELQIYINTLKTFLKLWAGWDDIEKRYDESLSKLVFLDSTYNNLKAYLKSALVLAQTELCVAIKEDQQTSTKIFKNNEKVTLNVVCDRKRLHNLFYQQPDMALSIFNMNPIREENVITLHEKYYGCEQMFNWLDIQLTLKTGPFLYSRKITGNNNFKLFNKKLIQSKFFKPPLPNEIFQKKVLNNDILKANIKTTAILQALRNLKKSQKLKAYFEVVIDDFFNDIMVLEEENISANHEYQYYLSKYSYMRSLPQQKPPSHKLTVSQGIRFEAFDLELREIIQPSVTIYINTSTTDEVISRFTPAQLTLKCLQCQQTFSLTDKIDVARTHFLQHHKVECLPDWSCTKCEDTFGCEELAKARWFHTCRTANI